VGLLFCKNMVYIIYFLKCVRKWREICHHILRNMLEEKSPKVAKKFECEFCQYVCCKKSDYIKHLSTRKHKMVTNGYQKSPKNTNEYACSCECGNSYKHKQGLSRHKKVCKYIEEKNTEECPNEQNTEEKTNEQNNGGVNNELVIQLMDDRKFLIEQNQNLQNLVVPLVKQVNEIIPKIGNNNTNTTNTNSNNTTNNKFNLCIYLNEKCKDAIPLVDFIENLKITDTDYDTTRTEGIVNGLTDIFTKELRNLDVRQLPIHCSDLKRETFYIKNDDEWVKDDSEKTILSKAICTAKDKANKFLPRWLEDHPLCWKQDNNYHTQWMDIVTVRYGKGDPNFNEKNTRKILKNLAQEVVIDKETAMIDEE